MAQKFAIERTALIAVDYQYECLSPGAVWPVHNAPAVIANARIALEASRQAGIPIIYTKHVLDPRGHNAFRYEPRDQGGKPQHSVPGDAMSAFCAELAPTDRDIVVEKQRWSGFYCTQLDLLLRKMDVHHLVMMGVWTESCFETTVWDALWRDYKITIIKDACGTATPLMHMTGILDMANWLYGGRIFKAAEYAKALRGEPHTRWAFQRQNAFLYTIETVEQLYDSI
jgi:nicotinamidase-related amidase